MTQVLSLWNRCGIVPRSVFANNLFRHVKLVCRWTLLGVLPVLICSLTSGCKTAAPSQNLDEANKKLDSEIAKSEQPQIYSIGERPVLNFEPNKELVVPISGAYLAENALDWSIRIDGVVPAVHDVDYSLRTLANTPSDTSVNGNNAEVVFSTNYTALLKDGDTLTINADLVESSYSDVRRALQNLLDTQDLIRQALTNKDVTNFNSLVTQIDGKKAPLLESIPSNEVPIASERVSEAFDKFSATPITAANRETSLGILLAKLTQCQQLIVREYFSNVKEPIRASGFREFQAFTSETYRTKFLQTRFSLNEIKAFPLPDAQVEEIFGNKVRDHFYVVAFSAENDSSLDRLVNIGMINAYGRALVFPVDESLWTKLGLKKSKTFTIPVQVSPESVQMVYSDVSQSHWNRPREWVFRSLNFGGALATAIATGFFGDSASLIKALSIYSGVGVPAFQQFWPDQVPNYLGYVVAFGMPDLVKVPQNGGNTGWKLLFFSKDNINNMISDPSLFGHPGIARRIGESAFAAQPFKKPETYVVYLAFDTLEVPFESISGNTNAVAAPIVTVTQSPAGPVSTNQTVTFLAHVVGGTAPFGFQWLKGTTQIQDGTSADATVSGSTNETLVLSISSTNAAGTYSVQVNDSNGKSARSAGVDLKVH